MDRLARKRPSPSLILSFVTLSVALTSSAGALSGTGKVERGDLAKNSVTARALAKGSVTKRSLANRSITSRKLANDAVTEKKLAHFSVGASALGDTTVVSALIQDADSVEGNASWTNSALVDAVCPPGSTLLGGGVSIADGSTLHQVAVNTSAPVGNLWRGSISTNSGGTASGRVYAVCLL